MLLAITNHAADLTGVTGPTGQPMQVHVTNLASDQWWHSWALAIVGAVGALAGVALGAYLARKNAVKLLSAQTKHDAASEAEVALYRIRQRVNGDESLNWGDLHNQLSDEVYVHLGRLRNPEVSARIDAVGYTIFLCFQYPDEALQYGVLCSIADARRALQALLEGEEIPEALFLTKQELSNLLRTDRFPNFVAYHDWLERNVGSID